MFKLIAAVLFAIFALLGCSNPPQEPLPISASGASSNLMDECRVKKVRNDEYASNAHSGCLAIWGKGRFVYAIDVFGEEGYPWVKIYRASPVATFRDMSMENFLRHAHGFAWPKQPGYSEYAVAFSKNERL